MNKPDPASATVWLLDAHTVSRADLEFFVERLGPEENRRYRGFARRQRQLQFLLGRVLVRLALADLTGMSPESISLIERTGRAPQLHFQPWPCREPSFSISHSRQWIACAAAAGVKLGIDVEVNDRARDTAALSRMALEPDEQLWLRRQPESARTDAFYELWSSREALYKLRSTQHGRTDRPILIDADGRFRRSGSDWYRYSASRPGVALVVCSDRKLTALHHKDLANLARSDWLAANRTVSASSLQAANGIDRGCADGEPLAVGYPTAASVPI